MPTIPLAELILIGHQLRDDILLGSWLLGTLDDKVLAGVEQLKETGEEQPAIWRTYPWAPVIVCGVRLVDGHHRVAAKVEYECWYLNNATAEEQAASPEPTDSIEYKIFEDESIRDGKRIVSKFSILNGLPTGQPGYTITGPPGARAFTETYP